MSGGNEASDPGGAGPDQGWDGDGDPEPWVAAGPPRWVPWVALLLSLLGLADSAYLTVTHYSHTVLFCPSSGFVNCTAVTTSAESKLLGIPVALLGLLFFVAMTIINLPALWHRGDRRIAWARLIMVVTGMAMVLWLLIAELFIIKNLCEYCTGVHIITFLLFCLVVITFPATIAPAGDWDDGEDGAGAPAT